MIVAEGQLNVVVLVTMAVSAMMSPIKTGPKNQVKNVGDSVEFTCVTRFEKCSGIEWYKREEQKVPVLMYRDGQGKRNLDVFDYTNYSVDAAREGCSLTINNLRLGDSGGYLCSIIHEESEHRKFGALLVVDPSKKQCRSSLDQNEISESDVYSMTCSIAMRPDLVGFTRDSLVWFSKGAIMKSNITRASDVLSSQYSSEAKAKDKLEFTCKVFIQPDSDPTYNQTKAELEVCKLPNKTVFYSVRNIRLSPSKTTFIKGDKILCMADGYPPSMIKWRNLNTSEEFKSSILKVKQSGVSIGDVFMCTASNTIKNILYEVNLTGIRITAEEKTLNLVPIIVWVIYGVIVVGSVVAIMVCVRLKGCPLYGKIIILICGRSKR